MRIPVILSLAVCVASALILTLTAVRAQDREEDLQQQELESLKRAWKKHEQEKKEENPSGASPEEQESLEAIAGKMRIAERKLSEEDTGGETQKKQIEAIDLLNNLINRAEDVAQTQARSNEQEKEGAQRQKLIEPSRQNPALPNSQVQKALVGKTEREAQLKRTGDSASPYRLDLPAREREAAQPPDCDQFPEKYRKHLERYYKEMLKDDKMK